MNGYANGNGNGVGIGRRSVDVTHDSYPQRANEWETFRTADDSRPDSPRRYESVWEAQEASHHPHSEMEREWETERSARQALQGIRQVARITAPFAQRLVSIVTQALLRMPPSSSRRQRSRRDLLMEKFIRLLLQEGDRATTYLEAECFGFDASDPEVSDSEIAQEAALLEVLAAEASHTWSESEASAFLGTAVPISLRSVGSPKHLRSSLPTLIAATARFVHLLYRQGTPGRRLLRVFPTILRRTIASLQSAARLGCPITATLTRRVMVAHAARVFGNPRLVQRALIRNAIVRRRTVATARS